jgi:predicted ATPase
MIKALHIHGFKRFAEQTFAMKPMTVLAGMNGAGKTSLIHALLLVREAWRRADSVVELNGPFGLELGGFEDVLNHETQGNFSIKLFARDDALHEWIFSEGSTELYARVSSPELHLTPVFVSVARAFQFLSAERLGPRITQGSAALPPDLLAVGCHGEYCAQVLDTLGKNTVDELRRCPAATENDLPLLKAQTEQWLSRVTRPVQIDTDTFAGTPVTAVKFRTGENWAKPTNMGFGVTYALPVILAGLTAGAGGLLLVENPEAHLHPRGQSQMGLFLATIAAAGVQLVVETHSDHILNGIRRAIGEQRVLTSENAIVHYFDGDRGETQSLEFTPSGGISSWPSGFFDQYQLDVMALTRIRRSR